jgi:hypothetical protein
VSITEFISTTPPGHAARPLPCAPPTFPAIEPGQLWLIELPPGESQPSPLVRCVLDQVNVVIYDRALTDLVANSLPLGGYAEPAASTDEANDPAAARAVHFAGDGWSVARLVPARPTQRERIVRVRRLIDELATTKAASEVVVTVLGELSDGVCEPTQTRLNRLDQVVVTYPRDARLTIVVDGLNRQTAARLYAVAGNGLAG